MRRFFLVILLLLLPLQLSWAAMASYCQNEAIQTRAHFGHHEHTTTPKSVSTKEKVSKGAADNDVECGFCHLSCAKSVCTYPQLKASVDFNPAVYPFIHSSFSSHIAEGPEKPNWHLAA
ncbi:cation efflux protein, CzcI family [Herbaspirillum sp. RV1423]|uniref:cation efflux protein, CzcI family n=1 Tax=Herbaspirillum sp. RV1423 TaxID=1443993 RepID=UPI0004B9DFF9|nr:cation efflux protein, CzcI family [Herbaspirillum sp. RV1423]